MKRLILLSVLATACEQEEAPPKVEVLDARGQLIRLSVDLRGVHPSEAELVAIEANPALYEEFVDRYLDDERFVSRMKEVMNLRYLTRNGDAYYDPTEAGLGNSEAEVADALAEEPLALIGKIIEEDLPFSEMVLAEYTMANPIVAAMWDIEIPDGSVGFVEGTYRDGRPHAGILTMQTFWERYPSMGGNANRHRANAVSRVLLCDDYLSRPIVLNRAAVDQLTVDPEDAISTSETCQSCHSTLDPLSAHFFGFFHPDPTDSLADTVYLPENEQGWRDYAGKEPAWFGVPTSGIRELAESIADDPRFRDCAVESIFTGLTQRELSDQDWSERQYYTDRFEAEGMRIKPLVRDIVTTDLYKAERVNDAELDERLSTLKVVSPAQLASVIEGITGYRWSFSGRDGLTTHDLGLPVLAGGVDGGGVTVPSYMPGVGLIFIHERLAQAAANSVAAADLDPARTGEARLLKYVTIEDTPESNPEAFDAQIRALYVDVTGRALAADATEPAALMTLWKELYSAEASAEVAWAGVLSAVLRDPQVLFY